METLPSLVELRSNQSSIIRHLSFTLDNNSSVSIHHGSSLRFLHDYLLAGRPSSSGKSRILWIEDSKGKAIGSIDGSLLSKDQMRAWDLSMQRRTRLDTR
jgi:hypothetical protein